MGMGVFGFIILMLGFASLAIWLLWKLWNLDHYLWRRRMERMKKAMGKAGWDENEIFIIENTMFYPAERTRSKPEE